MTMLFRDIKRRILPYSSSVMLISRKLMQDKRVVTVFRHLNVRIAKNIIHYPFLVLGNSKCEILSGLDFKGCIPFAETLRGIQKILWYITLFWKCIIHISKNAYGIEYLTFPYGSLI